MPKSMNAHSMPSRVYSSCSRTNIWWLKNCCNFSFVKLMQSCSKLLNCSRAIKVKIDSNQNFILCFFISVWVSGMMVLRKRTIKTSFIASFIIVENEKLFSFSNEKFFFLGIALMQKLIKRGKKRVCLFRKKNSFPFVKHTTRGLYLDKIILEVRVSLNFLFS